MTIYESSDLTAELLAMVEKTLHEAIDDEKVESAGEMALLVVAELLSQYNVTRIKGGIQ